MENLYTIAFNRLRKDHKVILATIINRSGSTPRSVGTKCLFLEDGSIIGTIGGGLLEYQATEKAKDVFEAGKSSVLNFKLTGEDVANSEMLCGGIADVYLEPLFPSNRAVVALLEKITSIFAEGKKGTLFTRVSIKTDHADETCRLFIAEDGQSTGSLMIGSEDAREICKNFSRIKKPLLTSMGKDEMPVFVEPVRPDDILYLFGAGHISTFVAPLAKMVGFKVVVIDDRDEFANSERFQDADEVKVVPFSGALDKIEFTPSTYIVIVTRGHVYDRNILKGVIDKKTAYIGMIGSRRKKKIIFESLVEDGVHEKLLDRVHSPIGLDIGADTPEEIAVSIVAELIDSRTSLSA